MVEKAGALCARGYPIGIRGTATEVVRRMGILPELRDAHTDTRRCTFLDADGSTVAALDGHSVAGGEEGPDLEVRRGDLATSLYAPVRDDVDFLFDDSIDTLDESEQGVVGVTFRGGKQRTFDPVLPQPATVSTASPASTKSAPTDTNALLAACVPMPEPP